MQMPDITINGRTLNGQWPRGEDPSDMSLHTGIPEPSSDQAVKYGRLRVWPAGKKPEPPLVDCVFAERPPLDREV